MVHVQVTSKCQLFLCVKPILPTFNARYQLVNGWILCTGIIRSISMPILPGLGRVPNIACLGSRAPEMRERKCIKAISFPTCIFGSNCGSKGKEC